MPDETKTQRRGRQRNDRERRARIRAQFEIEGVRTPGMEVIEQLLQSGDADGHVLTPEIAEQAIEGLEDLELPWLLDEIIESGERFAEQVHSEATRGLQEVVQNADDQGARNIRFGFRARRGGALLLIAHDGNPVELIDVLRMALPLLSGSRGDPDKIGRFGIGLKTLNQLGDRLGVVCPPLPGLEIQGGRVKRVRTAAAIKDFWDPTKRETLFVLKLRHESFNFEFFKAWLSEWDASSLLFLRSLNTVSLRNLGVARSSETKRGIEVGRRRTVDSGLKVIGDLEVVRIKDLSSQRRWTRYAISHPRPKRLKATNKEVGASVRLQIAVPDKSERGRVFAGLPLEEQCDLPFSCSAPFDPNVDRTRLRDNNALNEWLIAKIGDLATATSIHRFAEKPKSGWQAVPLVDEGAGNSPWARDQFTAMVERQQERVQSRVRLSTTDGPEVRLKDLAYEPQGFEGLLSAEDVERLWLETSSEKYGSRRAVPEAWRDQGRWRDVLADISSSPLWVSECLTILDWDDSEIDARGARWLVSLVFAALESGEDDELWERPCIALAKDGGRCSPAGVDELGTLLVHSLPTAGLAASLDLAQQIARPFRAGTKEARTVRAWLHDKGLLRQKASDADALRALAGADREEPIDLRRRNSVLQRIRNTFEQLPSEERSSLGGGVGRNISLSGYVFEAGKRVDVAVRPSQAYLPSAIDKNEGWPAAAAKTPGIHWIATRYKDDLKGSARGQGALAFLRALGAASAPRLEKGPLPPENPNAVRLAQTEVPVQQKDQLTLCPKATGLKDDWISPDAEAVVEDLMREKGITARRKRARALFLTLDRAWEELYADRSTAVAVHHYYSWFQDGEVSATWIAELASQPWLSTHQSRFHAAAPRDLTILTEAGFEIEGERPEKYAHEIDKEHVDSPTVSALGIQGRPFASSILDRLEAMRDAEISGERVEQAWANRCYQALASYAPGGRYEDRSDLSPQQLKMAFSGRGANRGLIRAEGVWLKPKEVRLPPILHPSLPTVTARADSLWELLAIKPPTAADCVSVLERLAKGADGDRSSEALVLRHLVALNTDRRLPTATLKAIPVKTYSGWKRSGAQRIYAVVNPSLAEALGSKWPVWDPPIPVTELASLLPAIGIELLDESRFEPEIPSGLAQSSLDIQGDFAMAVSRLEKYLGGHQPRLHGRLSAERWTELRDCQVISGSGWAIRVKDPRRRTVTLRTRAHLFRDPLRFCVSHDDEIPAHDAGGLEVAGFFAGEQPAPEDLSTIALAWNYAFNVREDPRIDLELTQPDVPEDAPIPNAQAFDKFRRKERRRARLPPPKKTRQPIRAAQRELVKLEDLDLDMVHATFLEARRQGTLRPPKNTKMREPTGHSRSANGSGPPVRAGVRAYADKDREDLALAIVEANLAATRGLSLVDIREDPNTGADAVDKEKDIWVELKTHGREAADSLRLERSEAERATEKRGNYWLVVVWNLEQPLVPQFVVVPDPMRRLDTYLGRGMQLTGIRELAEQSASTG